MVSRTTTYPDAVVGLHRTGQLGPQHERLPGAFLQPWSPPLSFLNMTLQFFVTTAPCDFLDGKHVVFGKVIDGMLTLRKIENVPTGPNNRPKLAVKITGMFACGFVMIRTFCLF